MRFSSFFIFHIRVKPWRRKIFCASNFIIGRSGESQLEFESLQSSLDLRHESLMSSLETRDLFSSKRPSQAESFFCSDSCRVIESSPPNTDLPFCQVADKDRQIKNKTQKQNFVFLLKLNLEESWIRSLFRSAMYH